MTMRGGSDSLLALWLAQHTLHQELLSATQQCHTPTASTRHVPPAPTAPLHALLAALSPGVCFTGCSRWTCVDTALL